MAGGRPEEWTIDRALDFARSMYQWLIENPDQKYYQAYIVRQARVPKDTLSYLERKFKALDTSNDAELTHKVSEFLSTIKSCKDETELRLLETVGKGEIKSIFVMKNHYGYADKIEQKSQNVNYNYDPAALRTATEDDLNEVIRRHAEITEGE